MEAMERLEAARVAVEAAARAVARAVHELDRVNRSTGAGSPASGDARRALTLAEMEQGRAVAVVALLMRGVDPDRFAGRRP